MRKDDLDVIFDNPTELVGMGVRNRSPGRVDYSVDSPLDPTREKILEQTSEFGILSNRPCDDDIDSASCGFVSL
jgi:hypothetical protein